MSSSSTGISAPATSVRKLRTFLDELMSAGGNRPAISQRIAETRQRRLEEWAAENSGQKGNPFTQDRVALRIGPDGVTAKIYGGWERGDAEPSLERLRQIAVALGLDEDYFMPTGDLASATARVEAEADRLSRTNDAMESLLGQLQALLQGEERAQVPLAPD